MRSRGCLRSIGTRSTCDGIEPSAKPTWLSLVMANPAGIERCEGDDEMSALSYHRNEAITALTSAMKLIPILGLF